MMEGFKSLTACFTGHRHIQNNLINGVKVSLEETVISLANQGITTFFNGGAMGFDMLAAEKIINLKKSNGLAIKLIMVLPCKGHDAKWNDVNKARMLDILDNADEIICLSERYYDGCMEARNRYLTEHSGVCVAYMKHGRSGTSQTVRMAREYGLTVINLAENTKGVQKMVDFEKGFSDFIDSEQYDKADEAVMEMLFSVARSSFKAGWVAAGGEAPQTTDGLRFTRPSRVIPFKTINTENG
jgi:uncharacterized phage-like protein YoqJ